MLTSTSQEFLVLFFFLSLLLLNNIIIYIYDICTPLKENVNYYFYLLMLFSFYNNIYVSIRLFIINYYFIDLFKIRPESNFRS